MYRKRILFVNPWVYDFTAYDLWMKPLGLLYLASHLRNSGYQVTLLDCMDRHHPYMPISNNPGPKGLRSMGCGGYYREKIPKPIQFLSIPRYWSRFGIPWDRIEKYLSEIEPPEWVFITGIMTYWYPGQVAFFNLVRQIWKKAQIIIGGWYPTLCSEHARQWGFDRIVSGVDPLQVIKQLSSDFRELSLITDYKKFFSVKPSFDLYTKLDYTVVLTSIGCPFRCTYCASGRYFPEFWRRPWGEVLNEIIYDYQNYRIQDIAFYDDALLYRTEESFLPLLRALQKEQLPIRFHLPNSIHARYVTREIAELMRECNFKTLRISLEFSDAIIQKNTGNKVNNSIFEKAIQFFIQAGYAPEELEVYLLFGLPGLNVKDYEYSIQYVTDLGLKPRLSLFSPIPGTPDFERATWHQIKDDPLLQNKIAYLYLSEQNELYEALQRKISILKIPSYKFLH